MLHLCALFLFALAPDLPRVAPAIQEPAAQAPGARADGGPLDLATLPASTRWVAHLDLEALRQSTVGAYLLADERRGETGWSGLLESLVEMEEEYGFDVRREVHSATMYGGALGRDASAFRAVGTETFRAAAERVTARDSYRPIELEGALVHTWVEEEADGVRRETFLHVAESAPGRFTATMAATPLLISQALRVNGGEEPSLAAAAEREWLVPPSAGAFLYTASAVGLDALGELDPQSQVGSMVRRFQGEVGEAEGQFFARLFLATSTAKRADQLAGVLSGLRALGSLSASASEEPVWGLSLLDWLSISANGQGVAVELVRSAEDVRRDLSEQPL